jgi:outer membrane protein assembly factor BamB
MLAVSIFQHNTVCKSEEQTTQFPWTTYKHNFYRSGYTESPAPQQPTLLWKSEISEYFYLSSPSIANGKVFIGKYALDQTSGYLLWDSSLFDPQLVNAGLSPTVESGEVYLTTFDGYIYCLHEENGAPIWSYKVGEGEQIYSCPAVTQDKVFVTTTLFGSETGYLYALWKQQGTFLWKIEIGISYSSPAVLDGIVFVASYQDVYAISEEGNVIWHSSIYPDVFA